MIAVMNKKQRIVISSVYIIPYSIATIFFYYVFIHKPYDYFEQCNCNHIKNYILFNNETIQDRILHMSDIKNISWFEEDDCLYSIVKTRTNEFLFCFVFDNDEVYSGNLKTKEYFPELTYKTTTNISKRKCSIRKCGDSCRGYPQ